MYVCMYICTNRIKASKYLPTIKNLFVFKGFSFFVYLRAEQRNEGGGDPKAERPIHCGEFEEIRKALGRKSSHCVLQRNRYRYPFRSA